MRILVAEDDEAQLQWLHRKLTGHGHNVCTATEGDEALDMYERNRPFDMVVTDFRFPGKGIGNGFDLIASIQAIDPLQSFIIQTSETNLVAPLGVPLIRRPYPIQRLLRLIERSAQPSLRLSSRI